MNKSDIALKLQQGETIDRHKEKGNSMLPLIKSGQPVKIEPVAYGQPTVGDIVFCKVKGKYYLHKISKTKGNQYQISNNKGHINGWISINGIYGIVTKIYDE